MTIEDYLDPQDKALWRDTQRRLNELGVLMAQWSEEAAATDARFKKGSAALADQSRETDRRLRELGEATDARIAELIAAIREGRHPQQ
jgi:hypothetical protein